MGNVYYITRCYYCKKVFEGWPANSLHCPECGELIVGPHSVMVHRAENWGKAESMLNSDMSITEVSRRFCTDCGGYQDLNQPCTCMVDQAKEFEEKYPSVDPAGGIHEEEEDHPAEQYD